ncbi:MAG: glutamine-hydrolyzing carbamoyl-phosphate synthase small subunit [Dethiobacteria bacterium]|jgi:carbamoyl-phosphate synthase small subunit|nr:glutamine-hydrolyzing carbamoyl-phosphate synthase small subunit [Bacillota bacterium]
MRARLVLEDGTVFTGEAFGAAGDGYGEVVFTTAMTGYQELLTDPSFCGHIVVMTHPLIGNYGINDEDFESRRPFLSGLVVKELCEFPSNWRATKTLDQYLKDEGIVGIKGVDTRALTRLIRKKGALRGYLTHSDNHPNELIVDKLKGLPSLNGRELVNEVTTPSRLTLEGDGPRVVLLDLGTKMSIARSLQSLGCRVEVVPAQTKAAEILALNPDGIVLSNGPGDPRLLPDIVVMVRKLLGKLPLLGICLGHLLLALACGAEVYKLSVGHRGANHPVKELQSGRVTITTQNHGYAVKEDNLPSELLITHRNLNDGTIEGLRHQSKPALSVQFHPQAVPGFEDSLEILNDFLALMGKCVCIGADNNA